MSSTFENPLVVGCGSWGTALALLLTNKCPQVHLLGRNQSAVDQINSSRENKHYLPGITLPPNLITTTAPGRRRAVHTSPATSCSVLLHVTT